jgi:hypothetical protein
VSRPFVKVYRYRLRADAVGRCVEAWRGAHAVYARYVPTASVSFFRSLADEGVWLEVSRFPDEASYQRALSAINADPALAESRREFEAALADPAVTDEAFEEVLRLE